MEAAAHTPGGYGGVPQSVGKEFAAADEGSPKSRDQHMAKRRKAGLSHSAIGKEFGVSKSTSHRHVGNMIRNGYTRMGKA